MLFGNLAELRPERDPDFVIGPSDDPYMLRWWLVPRNKTFNVYYHHIRHSDDDRALHDHPYPSVSIMVKGMLDEITPEGVRRVEAGDVVFREPEASHRLQVVDGGTAETLFITGPVVRAWGFHCPKGWVHFKDFVGENPGEVGRGCGEMA